MRLLALRPPRGLATAPARRCRLAAVAMRAPPRSSRVARCTARVAAAVTTEDGEPAENDAVRTAHECTLRLFSGRAPCAMQVLVSRIRDAAKTRLTALLQRPQARPGQTSERC
jgi:hypothetical protein